MRSCPWLVLPLTLALGCCNPSKDSTKDPAPPGTGKEITISPGADGGVHVSGAGPLKGDPKTCAAFRACCSAPSMGLYCGLLQSTETDCGKLLTSARAYIKESNTKPPAGCM